MLHHNYEVRFTLLLNCLTSFYHVNLLFQVALYETPDKPTDALSFLRNNFVGQNIKELQDDNEELRKSNKDLVTLILYLFVNWFSICNNWGTTNQYVTT